MRASRHQHDDDDKKKKEKKDESVSRQKTHHDFSTSQRTRKVYNRTVCVYTFDVNLQEKQYIIIREQHQVARYYFS